MSISKKTQLLIKMHLPFAFIKLLSKLSAELSTRLSAPGYPPRVIRPGLSAPGYPPRVIRPLLCMSKVFLLSNITFHVAAAIHQKFSGQ